LNGDAYLDVVTGNKLGVLNVLINNGDGTFRDKVDFDVGREVWNIDAIDMDGDASLDLLVGFTQGGNLGLLTNNGAATFELSKEYYWKGAWATNWRIADVDSDGTLDFVGVDSESVYVLPLEDGDQVFLAEYDRQPSWEEDRTTIQAGILEHLASPDG
jgi:hypothetical protein